VVELWQHIHIQCIRLPVSQYQITIWYQYMLWYRITDLFGRRKLVIQWLIVEVYPQLQSGIGSGHRDIPGHLIFLTDDGLVCSFPVHWSKLLGPLSMTALASTIQLPARMRPQREGTDGIVTLNYGRNCVALWLARSTSHTLILFSTILSHILMPC